MIILSLYKSVGLSVSESVCLFPNSSKTANPCELKFCGMIPLGIRKVLKNTLISRTVSRKIACILAPSGQFYSLQYESLTYLGGWWGVGRSISDRISYRNHYMCSGEATSIYKDLCGILLF